MIKKIHLCVFLLLLCSTFLYAGTTGKIFGTVIDNATGEPLAGANVIIDGTTLGAATDLDGDFFIINIPPGTYSVTASMIGYKSVTTTNVRITPDLTTTLEFTIGEEVLTGEVISVVADRPLIQRDVTYSAAITTAEEIENMPVNTINDVMSLSSGFIVTDKGSAAGNESIHIRGGRSNEILYMIDGFYVKDPHSGGLAADVPNLGIQDLSMITGGYNAEYANAMSGVVNIVTKEGTKEYQGSFGFSSDQFGITDLNNHTMRWDLTLGGPIPIPSDYGTASFFVSSDYYDTDTYLWQNESNVHDIDGNPITRTHEPLTMNRNERYAGKIVWNPMDQLKLIGGFNYYNQKQRLYDIYFKEIPDHNGFDYNKSTLLNGTINYAFDASTFMSLRASYFEKNYKHALTEDLSQIDHPVSVGTAFGGTSNYEFAGGYWGQDANGDSVWLVSDDDFYQDQTTWEQTYIGDITSQIHKNHLIKAGIEYHNYVVKDYRLTGINSEVDDQGNPAPTTTTNYRFEPVQFSVYVQDKMEYKDFVLNVGLRYDYLDAAADYAPDINDPLTRKETEPKSKISPRIGFGYPVTDNVNFHFSYGEFYQFPDFRFLYRRNTRYDSISTGYDQGYRPHLGNANLEPQTTVQYEFGSKIALSDEVVADVTVFYKDIYDYISTQFLDINPFPYMAIVNLDYANSRGIELGLSKRFSHNYSMNINYTYSRAEGNADSWLTHSNQAQTASVTGEIPPKKTVTLEWDQTHTFNFQFDYRIINDWGINVLGTFGSGLPYTPTDNRGKNLGEVNSATMPWTGTIDLRINKDFQFFGFKQILFANIWNVLDKTNVLNVFTSTGVPDESGNPNASEELEHRPHWFGPPRMIELGMRFIY